VKNERPSTVGKPKDTGTSRIRQTFYANILWYMFLGLVSLLTFFATGRVWDDVFTDTVGFIFLILGGGFTFASVVDALYERYYGTRGAGEKS
jgi:hypothetical protein